MAEAPNPPLHPKQKAIQIIEDALDRAESALSTAELQVDKVDMFPDRYSEHLKWTLVKQHVKHQLKVSEIQKS